ncbi:MAG: hypothetical protein P8K08_24270 [Fuerstiella sp.]|nr:hypothetical protein [Fuerstiella sp.]
MPRSLLALWIPPSPNGPSGSLADTMEIRGTIMDGDEKDDLFGEKADDMLLGGVRDKLNK